MTRRKIVHIVGTGTIGEPLIGMMSRMRADLGIDEITFHKRTPLITDRSKVLALAQAGAGLAVDEGRRSEFEGMGMSPRFSALEAIERAAVVVDCTPVGNRNKEEIYLRFADRGRGFIAQGSEHGFGLPYALDVNDSVLDPTEHRFIQVVSCNTHNIATLIRSIALVDGDAGNLIEGRFLCIRRASDLSQEGNFIPSPKVGSHSVKRFGTHHARDAHLLYSTLGHDLNLFSSAIKVNTQYMHTLHFSLRLREKVTVAEVEDRLRRGRRISVSYKTMASQVFSFGRDHGIYGRLLDHTVVPLPALTVRDNGHEIVGFCFTPQDGNSLASSMAAVLMLLDPETAQDRLSAFDPYCFSEV